MITYEELFKTILLIIVLYIVLKWVYNMIKENHELKFKNISISKIGKELKKKIEKSNKKNKIKKK